MLSIIQCVNGNYSVVAEGLTEGQSAKVNFHQRCAVLWNASDVKVGQVAVINEQLEVWDGCTEQIIHVEPEQSEEEPTPVEPKE